MSFPRMLLVKQNFPDRSLKDIPGTVQTELSTAGFGQNLPAGATVAIGVGSRGISNIATIVKSVVAFWKDRGMKPFIFPAMGSHGAATAEGQADVLAHYGIIEETMGCPKVSRPSWTNTPPRPMASCWSAASSSTPTSRGKSRAAFSR
jgi:hypothetical protein